MHRRVQRGKALNSDSVVNMLWTISFYETETPFVHPPPPWDQPATAVGLSLVRVPYKYGVLDTFRQCGVAPERRGYESLSILISAKSLSAGPSLMVKVPMRCSSFSSSKDWPSISCERNSSAIARQPGNINKQPDELAL